MTNEILQNQDRKVEEIISQVKDNFNYTDKDSYEYFKQYKARIDSSYTLYINKILKSKNLESFKKTILDIKGNELKIFTLCFNTIQQQTKANNNKKIEIIKYIIQIGDLKLIESVSQIKIDNIPIYQWYFKNDFTYIGGTLNGSVASIAKYDDMWYMELKKIAVWYSKYHQNF